MRLIDLIENFADGKVKGKSRPIVKNVQVLVVKVVLQN